MTMGGNVEFIFPINMYLSLDGAYEKKTAEETHATGWGSWETATPQTTTVMQNLTPFRNIRKQCGLFFASSAHVLLGHITSSCAFYCLQLASLLLAPAPPIPSHPILGQSNTHVSALFINRPEMMMMMGKAPPLVRPSCSSLWLAMYLFIYLPTTSHQKLYLSAEETTIENNTIKCVSDLAICCPVPFRDLSAGHRLRHKLSPHPRFLSAATCGPPVNRCSSTKHSLTGHSFVGHFINVLSVDS